MTRAVVPAMVERGWGRVVMVGSITGPLMATAGDVAYAAAKAAIVGLDARPRPWTSPVPASR